MAFTTITIDLKLTVLVFNANDLPRLKQEHDLISETYLRPLSILKIRNYVTEGTGQRSEAKKRYSSGNVLQPFSDIRPRELGSNCRGNRVVKFQAAYMHT